jgi:hypothetical protein
MLLADRRLIFIPVKTYFMGLLTPKGKKGDKKNNTTGQKNANNGSKFLNNQVKTKGFSKKQMPGSANRGS